MVFAKPEDQDKVAKNQAMEEIIDEMT